MPIYQFEWEPEDPTTRTRLFYTDGEAVAYAEIIRKQTGYLGIISILKQVWWEDKLANGYYWKVIY